MIVDLWSANTKLAINPSAVSDAPIVEVRRRALCRGRVRYRGLKEAAFVRGGRYGILIDFGLDIIEKKSACGASFNSKLTDPTMEATLGSLHRNARQTILQRSSSRISDVVRFGHATASAAKRLRSNRVRGSVGSVPRTLLVRAGRLQSLQQRLVETLRRLDLRGVT
jgi:hypothetical protein